MYAWRAAGENLLGFFPHRLLSITIRRRIGHRGVIINIVSRPRLLLLGCRCRLLGERTGCQARLTLKGDNNINVVRQIAGLNIHADIFTRS